MDTFSDTSARRVLKHLDDNGDSRCRYPSFIQVSLGLKREDLEIILEELVKHGFIRLHDDDEYYDLTPLGRERVEQAGGNVHCINIAGSVGPGAVVGSGSVQANNIIGGGVAPNTSPAPHVSTLPVPPEPYIKHDYNLQTTKFFGRKKELAKLDDWAASDDSIMIVEAIGGVGKSALTWHWMHAKRGPKWAGVIWWSFYEGDASMSNFLRHALAYITQQAPEAFDGVGFEARKRRLITALKAAPYLLVLDGLERIMVAYHRLDAAQMSDDAVDVAGAARSVRTCTNPQNGRLLQDLSTCRPSKVLISTRLVPSDLEDRHAHTPLDGVCRYHLNGMYPDDALDMMRHLGIRGDKRTLDAFMRKFGYHSLMLRIVAGMINKSFRARGDFDVWYEQKGKTLRLQDVDLKQRRTHIMKYAMDGLRPEHSKFLSQMSAFRYAVDYAALCALNPYPTEKQFEAALRELEERGLIHYNQDKDRFDLHPIVRAYAFERLESDARAATFDRIRDHFEGTPPEDLDTVTELGDLARTIEIYNAMVQGGHLDAAARLYGERLSDVLQDHIAAYHAIVELLTPLFRNGLDQLPALESAERQAWCTTDLAAAFYYLGRDEQAFTLEGRLLALGVQRKDAGNLGIFLCNYAISLRSAGQLAAARRACELARDLAEAADDAYGLAMSHHRLLSSFVDTGQWAAAEAAYAAFRASPPIYRTAFWQADAERYRAAMCIYRGEDAGAALDEAEALSRQSRNALEQRVVQGLRGVFALRQGRIDDAAAHFERAITMARRSGVADLAIYMGDLARTRALQGRHDEARCLLQEAFALECKSEVHDLYASAAEVYLTLGERDKAEGYARKAYKAAWADGPPFVWWWALERAKQVLAALGVAEPVLPRFDPAKVSPLPQEDEIRAFIAALRAEKAGPGAETAD